MVFCLSFLWPGDWLILIGVIDSDAKLALWLDKIEACPIIGLDTEADSLYSYPERLCLLQLAIADSQDQTSRWNDKSVCRES